MYHSLDDSGSVLSTAPALFHEQMRILHEQGQRVVSLAELQRALANGGPAEDLVAITFDDGFQNVYEHALPVVQRCGFPITVFLVSDYCGRPNSWPTQSPAAPRLPLLAWQQVAAMSRMDGVVFGSHTRTHPDLRRLPAHAVEEELVSSRAAIEHVVEGPVELLAYPYGGYDAGTRQMAGQHFRLACSTHLAFVGRGSDPLAVERIDTYYLSNLALFRRLLSPTGRAYVRVRRVARDFRARRLRRAQASQVEN
jgi:peptidoglycan/xylan/chitin deacetylase (PgdA/CDA1 family)